MQLNYSILFGLSVPCFQDFFFLHGTKALLILVLIIYEFWGEVFLSTLANTLVIRKYLSLFMLP